jgi:aminoglycoside phosphotransferase (APT) family kinase protein
VPVTDAELRAALAAALGRPVGPVVRRPWPYASTVPMEQLDVAGLPPLLFKDCTRRRRASRPEFLVDPLREIATYRTLLEGLDAPACHGAFVDGDRAWLFLERVEGIPLWQTEGLAAWEATARWLARLHARPAPAEPHLLAQDARHLRRWAQRASARGADAVVGLEAATGVAVERLSAWPAGLVHGELYASNVVVQHGPGGPRIRVVDWETAGVGAGILDLAALVSGSWAPERRDRVVAAYRGAEPAPRDSFDATLDAARLLVALQWLGWSSSWSPPAEHRYDWLHDVRELVPRLLA